MIRQAIDRVASMFRPSGQDEKPAPRAPETTKEGDARDTLNAQIDAMVQAAIEENRNWDSLDRDGINYLFGNQLANASLKQDFERIQCNKIFPPVMQELSILAQRRPLIVAEPVEQADAANAELWQAVLQWQFEKQLRVPDLLHRATLDAKTYGRAVVKLTWHDEATWNAQAERWEGMPEATLLRRWVFGCDPNAATIADAEYAYTRVLMPVEEAKLRWPKHEDLIAESAGQLSEELLSGGPVLDAGPSSQLVGTVVQDTTDATSKGPDQPPTGNESLLANLVGRPIVERTENVSDEVRPAAVEVLEIWFKDRERKTVTRDEPIPLDDLLADGTVILQDSPNGLGRIHVLAETGEPMQTAVWPTREVKIENVPVYPHGRRVLRIGPETIVEDEAWPLSRWPFAIVHNMILPHTLQGLNSSVMVKGLQDTLNEVASHFGTYLKLFADPQLKQEKGALSYTPTAGPGRIIETNPGRFNLVAQEPPPPMSAGAIKIYEILENEIRKTTGMEELALGGITQSKTKAEAVMLQTNSRMRTAFQSLLLDEFTVQLMEIVQEFCQAYWEPEQIVRVAGQGAVARSLALTGELLDARFDLRLDVGTSLPFDKEQKRIEATELFKMFGPAMSEYVLDAYDVPDKDKMLGLLGDWQAIQQMAALREQGGGQAGAQAPPGMEQAPAANTQEFGQ